MTGRQVIIVLKQLGFEIIRQHGSHVTLNNSTTDAMCTVPIHTNKILAPKTLKSIIKQANISVDELLK